MKRFLLLFFSIIFLTYSISNTAYAANEKSNTGTQTKTKKINWPKGPKGNSLTADSSIIMEASSGLILYAKNVNKVHYPASITKILTTLVALENSSLDEVVTFSYDAVHGLEAGSSNIWIEEGEKLTMEQCLYGIMLESANEACLGVAEHIAGSVSKFADMMNKKAKEIGCKNTNFSNPNGLHSDDHYTSAYDMALITQAAMKNETFRKITATKKSTIPKTNKNDIRYLLNHHQMIYGSKFPQYQDDTCISGKTGYTSKAQNTLVTVCKKGDLELICVVMKAVSHATSSASNQYTDTKKLLDFGFENYKTYNVSKEEDGISEAFPFFTKYNIFLDTANSPLHLDQNVKIVLPNGVNVSKAKQSVTYHADLPLKDGENIIGTVTYTYGNKTVGHSNIYFNKSNLPVLEESAPIKQEQSKKIVAESEHEKNVFLIILVASIGGIALLIFIVYMIFRVRRKSLSKKYGESFLSYNKDFDKL